VGFLFLTNTFLIIYYKIY